MHIVLLILKILGIALLVILGVILLLLLLILFVPVRYQAEGEIKEDMRFGIKGRVHYLLHIVSLQFFYLEDGFSYTAKIFGIPLKPKRKKKKREDREDGKADLASDEKEAFEADVSASEELSDTKPAAAAGTTEQEDGKTGGAKEKEAAGDITARSGKNKKSKIKRLLSKVREAIEKIKSFFQKLYAAITNFRKNFIKYKELITGEIGKRVINKGLRELLYLFSHVKFRKIRTDIRFSLGDPARTGQALGALCLLPVMYRYRISVFPDFEAEKSYVEGEFQVSGYMRAVHFLRTFLHLILDKECRGFVKSFTEQSSDSGTAEDLF